MLNGPSKNETELLLPLQLKRAATVPWTIALPPLQKHKAHGKAIRCGELSYGREINRSPNAASPKTQAAHDLGKFCTMCSMNFWILRNQRNPPAMKNLVNLISQSCNDHSTQSWPMRPSKI